MSTRFTRCMQSLALTATIAAIVPGAGFAQGAAPAATVHPAPVTNSEHKLTPAQPASSSRPLGTAVTLMPQNGLYVLTLTATRVNGRPSASTPAMSEQVSVGWSGSALIIIAGDQTLRGDVTNNHLSAKSSDAGGTLSLSGTPSTHSATGTFTLTQTHGASASGGFTLTPPGQQHVMMKTDPYNSPRPPSGPCGFWCQVMAWLA